MCRGGRARLPHRHLCAGDRVELPNPARLALRHGLRRISLLHWNRARGYTMPMTDEQARLRATEYVLQQYHLSTLQEAQQRLAPRQYEGVLREIDAIYAQLMAPPAPRPQVVSSTTRGINTPLGPLLPVTGLLLAIIWIVFILEEMQPGGSQSIATLVTFGATTPDVLATHQYWRLLSACF